MRHLLLILLLVLLPLRGWISDAMATAMVTPQVQHQTAAKTAATHAHEAGVQAHQDDETLMAKAAEATTDCPGHAFGEDDHADDAHCDSCSVCQACHTVALSPETATVTAALNPRMLLRAVVAQFVSAEHALGEKPPIS